MADPVFGERDSRGSPILSSASPGSRMVSSIEKISPGPATPAEKAASKKLGTDDTPKKGTVSSVVGKLETNDGSAARTMPVPQVGCVVLGLLCLAIAVSSLMDPVRSASVSPRAHTC